jgi:hypothetical protein
MGFNMAYFKSTLSFIGTMRITPYLNKAPLKSFDEKYNDLEYWLAQPVIKRLEAVTFLLSQTIHLKTTRLDKTHLLIRKMKA